jgi:hypothetical protein
MPRTLRYLVTTLLTLTGLATACGAEPAMPSPPSLKQQVLADFDAPSRTTSARAYGVVWQAWPRLPGNRIRATLTTDRRPGANGQALRLDYIFAHATAAEVGFRLRLPHLEASDYDQLVFWVKGDPQSGFPDRFKVEFQRPHPEVKRLSERGSTVVTGLSGDWQEVRIPLNFMTGIHDWTRLTAFVISFHSRRSPVMQGAILIDDLALIKTGQRGPSAQDRLIPARKQAWEAALGGEQAAKPHIHARLNGWPTRLLVDRTSLPGDDQGLLRRLAADTWRGLDALSDRENGLPLDNVHFGGGGIDPVAARIGDYTNVTNIGLHLIAIVAAHELQLLDRQQALTRLRTLLTTLEQLETYHGFFYNFYDTTTLERTSHFISFVDSAWLTAGLIVTRNAFPDLGERCSRLIAQGNYAFFYDPVEQQMSHGYYVNLPTDAEYRYGALYTEARLGSVIAIGKGDVPAEHWFRMVRTFPAAYRWQSQRPRGPDFKTVNGYQVSGGYYQWRGLRYIPSWGGSLFEALMPTLVLDELRHAPHSLGRNDWVHTTVQQRYAREVLHYPVWGMSPSSTPQGDGYAEYGVPLLGVKGYQGGAVTPHAAALALTVLPAAAVANLRQLISRYELYGEYGLYDAVEPMTGAVAHNYLALDQAMLFIALANYLQDRCIQKHFAADADIQRALPVLAVERFFE